MTIHNRLAAVRKERNFTQEEFSEKLGVSRSAYINYERGERELPSSLVIRLYELYFVSPLWILMGEGAQTSKSIYEIIEAAVLEVRSDLRLKRLEIDPEREARFIVLLVKYFAQGGKKESNVVESILENIQ